MYAEKCRVEELVSGKLSALHEQNSGLREQLRAAEECSTDLRCDVAAKEELVLAREAEKEVRVYIVYF